MSRTIRLPMLPVLLAVTGIAAAGFAGAADEVQARDGETLYTELGCVYCHGPAGREPALDEYPKLAGQTEAYLVQQSKDIRDRARDNGYTGMMQPAVVNVTDAELAAVARYLAGQPYAGGTPKGAGAKAYAQNACGSCHGPTGAEPIVPTYPKIAGQNRTYLINQMHDIKSGDRDNGASVAMRGVVANMGDETIVAIAEYLRGQ
ncbi:MAG: c-type cytochrome [Woeseiaceae bacterium]|nr:c-type cytochrome [Woeseiaceae bacterium]